MKQNGDARMGALITGMGAVASGAVSYLSLIDEAGGWNPEDVFSVALDMIWETEFHELATSMEPPIVMPLGITCFGIYLMNDYIPTHSELESGIDAIEEAQDYLDREYGIRSDEV